MNIKVVAGVLVGVLLVAAGAWYLVKQDPQPAVEAPVAEAEPSVADETQVKENLAVEQEEDYQQQAEQAVPPPLQVDGSDAVVRDAVTDLSSPLADLMKPQQLLRKWIVVIDQLAGYKWPTKNLPVSYTKPDFKVLKTDKGTYAAPENHLRWNALIAMVTAMDAKRVAVYYKQWSPLLESTYRELGNPNSFDHQLRDAIEHLLFIKPLPEKAKLHRPKVFFEYLDPALENADPLSKWMWRLGEENMSALQQWLKELKSYM